MDEKINIINSALYTLDLIPVQGIDNHERMCGVVSSLRSLRAMLQREAEKAKRDSEKTKEKDVKQNG